MTRIDIKSIRREQIIKVVREIIAGDGLEAVTIGRIAREAGLSRGVVTYHFRSKRAILHDALIAATREADRAVATLNVEGDLAQKLAQLTARVTELAISGNEWWRIYIAFLAESHKDDFYRAELAGIDRRYQAALERIVGGSARATILLALMRGLAVEVMVQRELSLEHVTGEITRLLGCWIAAPSTGGKRQR